MRLIFCGLLLFSSATSWAEIVETKINLTVPYTFGKHELLASKVQGQLKWSSQESVITDAEVALEVSDLEAKDQKLKCHLVEALTLDYSLSDYPKEHVCDGDDRLPQTGKNSPVFKQIKLRLVAPVKLSDQTAELEWEIHGRTRKQTIPIRVSLAEEGRKLVLDSQWKMKRSDYGIKVKKFLFIDAADELPVEVHMVSEISK